MAASFAPDRQDFAFDDMRARYGDDRLPEEMLAPVIAGAFARGIAETLNMLGVPGLFLDDKGRVLFFNEAARPVLDGPLRVRSHHLLAADRNDNLCVAAVIAGALSDPIRSHSVRLAHAGLTLHVMRPPGGSAKAGQLLHAILLIDDGRHPATSACLQGLKAD